MDGVVGARAAGADRGQHGAVGDRLRVGEGRGTPAAAFGAALAITLAGAQTVPAWVVILSALGMALAVSAFVLSLMRHKTPFWP